jgi:hypothetical protein
MSLSFHFLSSLRLDFNVLIVFGNCAVVSLAFHPAIEKIARRLADGLGNDTFDHEKTEPTVVQKKSLRAARTGEISLVRELIVS